MKNCTKCKIPKPLSKFNLNKTNKDGRGDWCNECREKWYATNSKKVCEHSRKYKAAHRDEERARGRKYRAANPEKIRALARKYRAAHPEKISSSSSNWYALHPEKNREKSRKWLAANPEKGRIRGATHRALKLGNGGTYTVQEWQDLKADYGNRCAYCGRKTALTTDHIVPLSCGGLNDIENIVPACKSCNSSKGDTPLLMWLYKNFAKASRRALS